MSSQKVCCGCNVFTLAKIITGIEFGLSLITLIGIIASFASEYPVEVLLAVFGVFVIHWAYLVMEYIVIHKKICGLIIFNCAIRVILNLLLGLVIINMLIPFSSSSGSGSGFIPVDFSFFFLVLGLIFTVPAMPYMIFRTWLQFKILKSVKKDMNNAAENNELLNYS